MEAIMLAGMCRLHRAALAPSHPVIGRTWKALRMVDRWQALRQIDVNEGVDRLPDVGQAGTGHWWADEESPLRVTEFSKLAASWLASADGVCFQRLYVTGRVLCYFFRAARRSLAAVWRSLTAGSARSTSARRSHIQARRPHPLKSRLTI